MFNIVRTSGSSNSVGSLATERAPRAERRRDRRSDRYAEAGDYADDSFTISSNPEKWAVKPRSETVTFEFTGSLDDFQNSVGVTRAISDKAYPHLKDKSPLHAAGIGDLTRCILVRARVENVDNNLPIPLGVDFSGIEGKIVHATSGRKFGVVVPGNVTNFRPRQSDLFNTQDIQATAGKIQLALLTDNLIRKRMIAGEHTEEVTVDGQMHTVQLYQVRGQSPLAKYCATQADSYEDKMAELYKEQAPPMEAGLNLMVEKSICDQYISDLIGYASASELKHANLAEMAVSISPTDRKWAEVSTDRRIGNSAMPEIRKFDLAKVYTVSVTATLDYYLPETISKLRQQNQ